MMAGVSSPSSSFRRSSKKLLMFALLAFCSSPSSKCAGVTGLQVAISRKQSRMIQRSSLSDDASLWEGAEVEEEEIIVGVQSRCRLGEVDEARLWVLKRDHLSASAVSRVVSALCTSPTRQDAALWTAARLLTDTSGLSQKARRATMAAVVSAARRRRAEATDINVEATLLEAAVQDDMQAFDLGLAREDDDCCLDLTKLTALARELAHTAPSGRPKTESLAGVAAVAYLTESNLDLALKRSYNENDENNVLRSLLDEALWRGDTVATRTLLTDLRKRQAEAEGNSQAVGQMRAATATAIANAAADDGDFTAAARALRDTPKKAFASDQAFQRCAAHAVRAAAYGVIAAHELDPELLALLPMDDDDDGCVWELRRARMLLRLARALNSEDVTKAAAVVLEAKKQDDEGDFDLLVADAFRLCERFAKKKRPKVAARLFRRIVGDSRPSAVVCDAALAALAAELDWSNAVLVAKQRWEGSTTFDSAAAYGAIRACATAGETQAAVALFDESQKRGARFGSRATLAVAAVLAAGDADAALKIYEEKEMDPASKVRFMGALLRTQRGAHIAASMAEQDFDDGNIVATLRASAALATRVGTARNLAQILLTSKTSGVSVRESSLARLVAAALRTRQVGSVREGLELLAAYEVRVEASVESYLASSANGSRDPGSQLYRAVFGPTEEERATKYSKKKQKRVPRKTTVKQMKDPPKEAQDWYDSRRDREQPPRDAPDVRRSEARSLISDETPKNPEEEAPGL